jgi:hypothetical protein
MYMKTPKLDLNAAAGEFECISNGVNLFYNIKTGEFDFYTDLMKDDGIDASKFNGEDWVAAPSQYDIDGYRIMVDFVKTVSDSHKNELLCAALEGAGVFRRFKDTLHRVDLTEEWYAFKHKVYVEIVKGWCKDKGIGYLEGEGG